MPGGCGYRDVLYGYLSGWGATYVGTLTGGEDVATCPISGLALANDGHTGFTCSQLQVQLASYYTSIGSADTAILHIGTNDIVAIALGTETMAQAKTAFSLCLATFAALNTNMTIFVANVLNLPAVLASGLVETLNAHILSEVNAYQAAGRQMYLIDTFNALAPIIDFNQGAQFNSGGVHPNATGYITFANKVYATLQTLKP